MSIESIPEGYESGYDSLKCADHESICLYVKAKMLQKGALHMNVNLALRSQIRFDRDLVQVILDKGWYVCPGDEDGRVDSEDVRLETFMAAMTIALETLDALAYELEIARDEWRGRWFSSKSFIGGYSEDLLADLPVQDANDIRGRAVMELGQRSFGRLEQPYRDLVDDISDSYANLALTGNIFKASFGYVFSAGRQAMLDIMLDSDAFIITPTLHQLNDELIDLVERQ